jgi:hypothetical protein
MDDIKQIICQNYTHTTYNMAYGLLCMVSDYEPDDLDKKAESCPDFYMRDWVKEIEKNKSRLRLTEYHG